MWICSFCGCENHQDDKIAMQEPSCMRCGSQKGKMEKMRDVSESHLADLNLKLIDERWRLEHLSEMKDVLEGEASTMAGACEEQLEIVRGLKSDILECENILLRCRPELYVRGLQRDQSKLIGWAE